MCDINLLNFPTEIFLNIFYFLDFKTILKLLIICKRFNKLIDLNYPKPNNLGELIFNIKFTNFDSKYKFNKKYIIEALNELNNLVGMETIKSLIIGKVKYLLGSRQNQVKLGNIIKGRSGSGKLTLAKIIGKIYFGIKFPEKKFNNDLYKITSSNDLYSHYLGLTELALENFLTDNQTNIIIIRVDYIQRIFPDVLKKKFYEKDIICIIIEDSGNYDFGEFRYINTLNIDSYTCENFADNLYKKLITREINLDKEINLGSLSKFIENIKFNFEKNFNDINLIMIKIEQLQNYNKFLGINNDFKLTDFKNIFLEIEKESNQRKFPIELFEKI